MREEIDALRVMGISPIQRLVAPRVLAALLVSMLLTVVVAMTAMTTAFAMVVGTGQISSGTYLDSFVGLRQPTDLFLAELKALIFGFIAVVVAAHKGLHASRRTEGRRRRGEPGGGPQRDPAGPRQRRRSPRPT